MENCLICNSIDVSKIDPSTFLFPARSSNSEFHTYQNIYCANCGVVQMNKFPNKEKLMHYYRNNYRDSDFAINLADERKIDIPIQIPWSGYSFARFINFYELLLACPHLKSPSQNDTFIDIGGYQGFFLLAVSKVFGSKVLNYEYSLDGLEFAKNALNIPGFEAKEITTDDIGTKGNIVSLVHVFEHLEDPSGFLKHLHSNILNDDGYIYIEVPNAYGFPLSDPTHFFTYTEISLSNILTSHGFKIEKIVVQGNQKYGWDIDNNHMNISVIASKTNILSNDYIAPLDTNKFVKDLKKSYSRIHKNLLALKLKRLFKDIFLLIIYLVIFVPEKILKIDMRPIISRCKGIFIKKNNDSN